MKIEYINKILFIALVISSIVCIPVVQAQTSSPDADQIIKKVKKTLDGMSTLSCSFEWNHIWKSADRTQNIAGTLQLKKPYRLRVEYPARTIVIDGKTVWSYSPKNRQVEITKFESEDKEFPTPQGIFKQYSNRKAVISGNEKVKNSETDVINFISPTADGKNVTVWVDRILNLPVKTEEVSPNGDVSTYILSNVRINGRISDSAFTFTPPEGIDVIDMRE